MQSLDAPAPSLLLSQTSSDKLCGVSKRLSYAYTSQTADSSKHSVWPTVMKLEQVIRH